MIGLVKMLILLVSIANFSGCSSAKIFDDKVVETKNVNFPFDVGTFDGDVMLWVDAGGYFNIFDPIMSRFGLYANGPTWEGLLVQAIEKVERYSIS